MNSDETQRPGADSTGNRSESKQGSRYQSKERKLSMNYVFWCLLWAIAITISDYTVERELIPDFMVWPVVLLPIVLTPLVFYQYYRFYIGIDEMTRKIQADSFVIGFALGMFVLIAFMSLANIGVPEPGVNEVFAIFAVSGMLGQVFRTLRYVR